MLASLEAKIGYKFRDKTLLRTALTHRSHSTPHNERLEFLGDSILDTIIALALFERFPNLPEGDLSRLRANLVRQDSLHQLARTLDLGRFLRLGEGELRSGGVERPSILADALEALFGALWLDAGFDQAQGLIVNLYDTLLSAIVPGQALKDAKTRLQEYVQGRRFGLPKYTLSTAGGAAHELQFKVRCEIVELKLVTEGLGMSRRVAEQVAAELALESLNK